MPYSLKLQHAADTLAYGGVIAYPTEAVWGLGCDPSNPKAVERLLRIKQRDPAKGLILVAASIEQFSPYLKGLDQSLLQQLLESWPGPQTYIVPDNGFAPALIRGAHQSVALRVSAHKLIVELCKAFGGPIVSTSANVAGMPAIKWPWQIQRQFAAKLDYLLPGSLGQSNGPTEIRDLKSGAVLRTTS